jgi:hypothetical protein
MVEGVGDRHGTAARKISAMIAANKKSAPKAPEALLPLRLCIIIGIGSASCTKRTKPFLEPSTKRPKTMLAVWVWVFLSIFGGAIVFQRYNAEIMSPTGMLVIACTISFVGLAFFPEAVRKFWIGISAALLIPALVFSCSRDVYCGSLGKNTQNCADYRLEQSQSQRNSR